MLFILPDLVRNYLVGLTPVREAIEVRLSDTPCGACDIDALWRYERLQSLGEWDVQSTSVGHIMFDVGEAILASRAFETVRVSKDSPLYSLQVLISLAGLVEGAFVEDWYEYEVLDTPRIVLAAPLRSLVCCTDRASTNAVYCIIATLLSRSRSTGFSLHLHFAAMGAIAKMSALNGDKELAHHLGLTLRKMIREWEDWEGKPTFREWAMLDIVGALGDQ